MTRTKHLVIGVFVLACVVGTGIGIFAAYQTEFPNNGTRDITEGDTTKLPITADHTNTTYTVRGQMVTLVNGTAEIEIVPGSASKQIVRYFGNEFRKDMNEDGKEDIAFIITEENAGSGTFYYVVVAVSDGNTYRGSDALFLGDRIAPQSTDDGPDRSFIVNYADRKAGEDFGTAPSLGKSVRVLLDTRTLTLGEWVVDFEGESNVGGKIKADMFTGKLEEVNTGCFADGECFIVVDGKHVTVLMGWSTETVGTVQGVEGFGDLESYVGSDIEVYARENEDGTYSLYGSEGFYVKLIGGAGSSSGTGGQGIAVGEPYPGYPGDDPGAGDEQKPQIVRGGCMVGGCSSQLCGDPDVMRDMVTTCEYRAQYACYQVATCERQTNGQCGWTMTSELTQCLRDSENESVMMDLEVQ